MQVFFLTYLLHICKTKKFNLVESFLSFFQEMTSLQKLIWIFACLSISWIFEAAVPLFKHRYKKWSHAGVNLIFLACTMVINVLFGLATVGIFNYLDQNQFGLLHLVELPIWMELVFAIMLFDLIAQYIVHYLLHKVSFMWRFHMIHHSDTKVDATTGTRHHPGDYVFREIFALITVLIIGAPFAFYMVYKVSTIFFTYFSHANINMPKSIDKLLSYVFITPNMHKFHHHYERPWTDTNFGNIFSIWDRLFGTFVYDDPQKIIYGLDVVDNERDEDVVYQFKIPFDKNIKTDY